MNKQTVRIVIVCIAAALLLWVYGQLLGSHYYRLTYAACDQGSTIILCGVWRREALVKAAAVVLVAVAVWVYNDRRSVKSEQP